MKSRIWKKTLALWLCVVMILTCGIDAFATEETACAACGTEPCICEQSDEIGFASEEPAELKMEPEEGSAAETGQTESSNEKVLEETLEELQDLDYEDNDVRVHVSEKEAGAIPAGASLKVTPITEGDKKYDEVEKQLNEKAEDEEYEIAGFLAYDICLTDKEGNEIEPNSQVKVSMEYKKVATPEGIENADDMNVTVMHFEENANGEVKDIVDMVEENAIISLQTTQHQEMKRVEFETESFSTFTITWTNQPTLRVKFLSANANGDRRTRATLDVLNEGNYNITFGTNSVFNTTQDTILERYRTVRTQASDNEQFIYEFKEVRNIWDNNVTADEGSVVTALRWENGQVKWRNDAGQWQNSNGQDKFYFIYTKYEPNLTTIATVDHEADGIVMTMTNHNLTSHDDQWKTNYLNLGGGYSENGVQGVIRPGLVKPILGNDGYPVTVKGNNSIKSAFTDSWDDARSYNTKQVNHLFSQEIYNETGYYEYNCFENFAYLGNNSNFTVYEQLGAPYKKDDYASSQYYTMRGNFLPYSPIERGYFSGNINSYDGDGNPLPENAPRYHEPIYRTNGVDYRFGMYLEVPFFQPRNGMVEFKGSTSPMRYEFNGDDDMWIYVDNVLLLDIGGIHDAHSGYIDFETGIIGWEDCATGQPSQEYTTTIKQRYREAGIFPDGSPWDNSKVDDYFEGNTFADYTSHKMKMFYMERGYGASNLHLRFNLATIPKGNVTVMKAVPDEFQEEYADRQFAYQIYAQKITGRDGAGREYYSETEYVRLDSNATYEPKTGADAPLVFHDGVTIAGNTYDDVFYLKPDERAVFTGLQENRKYYVVELGVAGDEFLKVNAAGTTYALDAGEYENPETTKVEALNRPLAAFVNTPASELHITKRMAPGQSSDDTFNFEVKFVNENGALAPYNGPYTLEKADGEVVQGTAAVGKISGVGVDDTVIIKRLAVGTEFQVTEVDLDENKYKTPVKTLVEDTYGAASSENADGKITAEDAQVVIQNDLKFCIEVEKEWSEITPDNYKEGIYAGLYKKVDGEFAPEAHLLLNEANGWKDTFYDLDKSAEYDVKELRKVKGSEEADFTISNQGYVAVADGETITINNLQFVVDNSGVSSDAVNVGQGYATITNTVLWQILKISATESEEQLKLNGAVFELTKDETTIYGQSGADGVMAWFRNCDKDNDFACSDPIASVDEGEYEMKEIKSPVGYFVSTEVWTIRFDDKGTPASIESSTGDEITVDVVDGKLTFCYENTAAYELPSAGGIGIYLYMIAGMMLMMIAVAITYKKRCKEVLRRR